MAYKVPNGSYEEKAKYLEENGWESLGPMIIG